MVLPLPDSVSLLPRGEGFCTWLGAAPCEVEGDPSPSLLQGWGPQAGMGTTGRSGDHRQGWGWHPRLDSSDGLMGDGVSAGPGDTLQIQYCAQEAAPHPHLLVSLTDLMGKLRPRDEKSSPGSILCQQQGQHLNKVCQARALPATVAATWPYHLHREWARGGR